MRRVAGLGHGAAQKGQSATYEDSESEEFSKNKLSDPALHRAPIGQKRASVQGVFLGLANSDPLGSGAGRR